MGSVNRPAKYPADRAPESIARACGVSIRTARRWKASGSMPAIYLLGLQLLEEGDLGALHPAWRGWCLRRDQLFSPENWGFRPGELLAIPLQQQLVGELRRQLAKPAQFELLP